MTSLISRSPTLDSVIMVEKTVEKNSGELRKYQLWNKLPRKMMYQTYQKILKYLEESGKLMIDKEGYIIWTHNPRLLNKLKKEGVKIR